MHVIHTTVRQRRIVIDAPVELSDGAMVEVTVAPISNARSLTEEEWDDSLEGAAAWMRWLDSLEPLILSTDDQRKMETEHQAHGDWEKARFVESADEATKLWP